MNLDDRGASRLRSALTKPDFMFPAILFLAWAVFFSDLLLTSKNLYFRDILNFHYPLRRILIDAYARWELPLWNPFVYLGQPMLANPNYLALYPSTVLHLFLPFDYAFKLHFVLHPLLGGWGLYCLLRRLEVHPLASFGGSLLYAFCGPVLSFLNLYSIVQAVALLPWIGWAFLTALRGDRLRSCLLFGLLLALLIITCEPLLIQSCAGLVFGLGVLFLLESQDRRQAARRLLRVGTIGGLMGMGLAAIQVAPALELLGHSARFEGYEYSRAGQWSLEWLELVNIAVPHLLGNPYTLNGSSYWGEFLHNGREGYLVSFFFGSGTVVLWGLSLFSRRRNLLWVSAIMALSSLSLALGHNLPFYRWMYDYVPGFGLGRFPSKYFLWTAVFLSVLAALGLEVMTELRERARLTRSRVFRLACAGLVAAAIFWTVLAYNTSKPERVVSLMSARIDRSALAVKDLDEIYGLLQASVRSSAVFLTLTSVLVMMVCVMKTARLNVLIPMILAAEVLPSNLRLVPLLSGEDVNLVPEVNAYLQRRAGDQLHRVVPLDHPRYMPPNLWAPNRSWAWLSLYLRRSGQPMHGVVNGIQYSVFFPVDDLNTSESNSLYEKYLNLPKGQALNLLGRLNSRILLTAGDIQDPGVRWLASFPTRTDISMKAYELDGCLPRAYFVPDAEVASDGAEALAKLANPDFDPWRSVVLQDRASGVHALSEGRADVRVIRYESSRVVCELDAPAPGFLVLLDSFYPGWRAYVDGAQTPVLKANFAFRAVAVREGRHRVEFLYRPGSFAAGAAISGISLLLGMILWLRRP